MVPAWNGRDKMCFLCGATSGVEVPWSDFSEEAEWRNHRWSHDAYMAYLIKTGVKLPVLLTQVIGLKLSCITVDTLHCVDLGIAAHILGGVFWLVAVLRRRYGGRTQDEAVANFYDGPNVEGGPKTLKQWYKDTKCDSKLQGKVTKERIRGSASEWTKLRGKRRCNQTPCPFCALPNGSMQ